VRRHLKLLSDVMSAVPFRRATRRGSVDGKKLPLAELFPPARSSPRDFAGCGLMVGL
jgi:hypothetical protein